MKNTPLQTSAFGALFATRLLSAEPEPLPDKSSYHLFRPTPRALMRDMSTDRPDQTESAYTVDAGHFQMELDFASSTIDRDQSGPNDLRFEGWGFGTINLKAGLLPSVDLQCVLDTYVVARSKDRVAGTVNESSGFGDAQTRLKVNLWGNDGGKTALALMPFVKWPLPESSLRNGKVEGGLIVPFGMDLGAGWGLGAMTEVDFLRNAANDGHDTAFINSITVSREISGPLSAYLEFFSVVSTARDADWEGQVDLGFTYALNENVQLDLGCNFGVTQSAPDFNPFVGMSWRF